MLAADKRSCVGGLHRTVTKIHRIGRLLVGGSGEPALIGNVLAWIGAGRDPATFPASQRDKDDWQPVMVIEDGAILIYERSPYPVRWHDTIAAIGSGRDFALAAMHLGKTAEVAVAVASHFDPGCGNGCDALTIEGAQ